MTGEPSDLPETPEAVLNRKAELVAALAEVQAGRSVRGAALSHGLPISTLRSAVHAQGGRTSPTVGDLIAALSRKVDLLGERLAKVERGLDIVVVDPRLQAGLDAIPKDAFAGLPGDTPGPSRSSASTDGGENK